MRRIWSHLPTVRKVSWVDAVVAVLVFGLLYGVVKLSTGMSVPFSAHDQPHISLHWWLLPYYAGRSLLRMFIAFVGSLIFSFVYGWIAARYKIAERVMIPLLDILQSVPVLGFLSVTITGFMALFPHSLLGVELASIFAIFTSQVWNITFGFYQSVSNIPRELCEASRVIQLDGYARFTRLELPHAMIGLVWNSMMSFGGAWFFLAASESISVLNHNIQLPGIGSFLATAIAQRNGRAELEAILTMVIVIVLVDQLFWRPIVAWSQKFKMELSGSADQQTSWFLQFLRRSKLAEWFSKQLFGSMFRVVDRFMVARTKRTLARQEARQEVVTQSRWLSRIFILVVVSVIVVVAVDYGVIGVRETAMLGWHDLLRVVLFGFYTTLRVFASTVLALLWTIPVGVAIGLNPKASRIAQPIVQITASFPANMFFSFVALIYLRLHISLQFGAIPLMMLGTQWYILFNVIAGAMAIPNDLKEATKVLGLTGWERWKRLILPSIFPQVVTGCITASGGAWNASIIAEVVQWGHQTMVASGLGALITQATRVGQWPIIVLSITVMALLVTLVNRTVWRPLLKIADTRYRIEISGR